MARHLWLLRHGEAVPHGSRDDDAERELTPNGEQQARLAGQALARLNVEFDACYASPKIRARDTARLAAEQLGLEIDVADELSEDFERGDIDPLLSAHDNCVLIVGHNPDFSQLVYDLTGARVDLMKGGMAAIELGPSSELLVLLRPIEIIAIAG